MDTWPADKVARWSIDRLVPYARNARTHSEAQVAQIAAAMREWGWTNPVLIDEQGGIIAGHGRVLAARQLDWTEVPVMVATGWSEAQKRAYVIADNKLSLNAGWDNELLALELADLKSIGADLGLTGFTDAELQSLLAEPRTGLTDVDAVPDVPESPTSQIGDLWLLGSHRVLCGDSTDAGNWSRLVPEQADLIFTDPPYGMSYGGGRAAGSTPRGARVKAHGMIANDDLQGEALVALVRDALGATTTRCKAGAALYVCLTWRTYAEFAAALESAGHDVKACIVWDKASIGLGNSHYRPQHEFILYGGGAWYGDKAQGDVWTLSRGNTAAYVHPTQKPVELIERALGNSSKAGDIVVDCFGGSGSTLIACETTGRHARLMELDPRYVDVIVRRWQEFTGEQAVLDQDGRSFDEVASARKLQAA
jgi:DNA modification methylase